MQNRWYPNAQVGQRPAWIVIQSTTICSKLLTLLLAWADDACAADLVSWLDRPHMFFDYADK